jgi:hypothetical protein
LLKQVAIASLGVVALPGHVCRDDVKSAALRRVALVNVLVALLGMDEREVTAGKLDVRRGPPGLPRKSWYNSTRVNGREIRKYLLHFLFKKGGAGERGITPAPPVYPGGAVEDADRGSKE